VNWKGIKVTHTQITSCGNPEQVCGQYKACRHVKYGKSNTKPWHMSSMSYLQGGTYIEYRFQELYVTEVTLLFIHSAKVIFCLLWRRREGCDYPWVLPFSGYGSTHSPAEVTHIMRHLGFHGGDDSSPGILGCDAM